MNSTETAKMAQSTQQARHLPMFVNSNERLECVVGTSFWQNFLSTGELKESFAVLSDRKVYFRGKCLVKNQKKYYKQQSERIVDIKDVTGSGFVKTNPIWLLVLLIVSAAITTLFLVLFLDYFLNAKYIHSDEIWLLPATFVSAGLTGFLYFQYTTRKGYVFEINFAGGGIAFEMRLFPKAEAEQFQLRLRQLKDQLSQESASVEKTDASYDRLQALIQHLHNGDITQSEFEAMKKQLLR